MVESGGLESRNRFHLINGYLVAKMTQNPPHAVADESLRPEPWLASCRPTGTMPVRPSRSGSPAGDSEPEPDRCIVRGTTLRLRGSPSRAPARSP